MLDYADIVTKTASLIGGSVIGLLLLEIFWPRILHEEIPALFGEIGDFFRGVIKRR